MIEQATFAAGCFWGVEETFMSVPGVEATRVGYTDGHLEHPTYKDVCSHDSGHAEAVEVTYNSALVSYEELLDVFWGCHDPTQLNRQGPDIGSQYRSAIFYHSEEQRYAAEESLEQLEFTGRYSRRIATVIVPATRFWEAEAFHQKYHQKFGGGCGF